MATLSICGSSPKGPLREHKGKSLLAFPDDYCVVDLETTGLSPEWDSIIEIAAVKFSSGNEIGRFQSLVSLPDGEALDSYITDLTGITNEMLADAPNIRSVLSSFSDFLGESIIVGYNVNFDINFLYDNFLSLLNRPLSNNFIDVMRFARKLHPELKHHRLADMVSLFDLHNDQAHRALSDCIVTDQCFRLLKQDAVNRYGDISAFCNAFSFHQYQYAKAKDIHGDVNKIDSDNPLFGKYCVFTGKLEKMTREEAMQLVADIGGVLEDRVTKNTNFLILGNNDYCSFIKDGKSNKQKKAEKYKLEGQEIEIIPENVFYDLFQDA